MILSGNNLGQRHKNLNTKVNDAAQNKVSFEQIKQNPEKSDIDKIFKLDLASKYKNIDYLIEILKSGDGFLITRALKCTWLYDADHANIINVDYLEHNVFPHMPPKMKRKFLTTASIYMEDENQIKNFYAYCTALCLDHIAIKFLFKLPENFKLNEIQTRIDKLRKELDGSLKFFIGDSFLLANVYLKQCEFGRNNILHEMRYLYSISDVNYLELVEKYYEIKAKNNEIFGQRLTKDIMKKHKERVLKNPSLYVPIMKKSVVAKHSSVDEAKLYLKALLPCDVNSFWNNGYLRQYRPIIDLLLIEKFKFIKSIFSEKYPGQPFEMSDNLYYQGFDEIMTEEEKITWALANLAKENDDSYYYYKFLPFEMAFKKVKNDILTAPDHLKRRDMLDTVVETAKAQNELRTYLEYYYNRHVNEPQNCKESFLFAVIKHLNVFNFDESCWNALYKLMKSIKTSFCADECNAMMLIYSILSGKDYTTEGMKLCLKNLIRTSCSLKYLTDHIKKLDNKRKDIVYEGLRKLSIEVIEMILSDTSNQYHNYELKVFINFFLSFLEYYEKSKEDIPEIAMKYMESNWGDFSSHRMFTSNLLTRGKILQMLKKEASLACDFPLIEKTVKEGPIWRDEDFRLTQILRKLKVYFPNDTAQEYLKHFTKRLAEYKDEKLIFTAVHVIFQLADEEYKLNFLMKYVPAEPKINHAEIDKTLLSTQIAICRFMYYSRPNLPLPNVLMYVKGDYVSFCLQMFDYYMANLTPALCLQFVEPLIDAPVKIQKHGLRLAFKCFSAKDFQKLVVKIWSRNKNISLRMVLYSSVHQCLHKNDPNTQMQFFELFKTMTAGLNRKDHDSIFQIMTSVRNLPMHLIGEYLEVAWKTVSTFPDIGKCMDRKKKVLRNIIDNVTRLNKEFILSIINDHIHTVFNEVQNKDYYLSSVMWDLTAAYVLTYTDEETLKANTILVRSVLNKCLEKWNEVVDDTFKMRQTCHMFINKLVDRNYSQSNTMFSSTNLIFECILQDLLNVLDVEEVYMTVWDLKLTMIVNKVADTSNNKLDKAEDSEKRLIMKEISNNFAAQVGKMIQEMRESELYHVSFVDQIAEKIDDHIKKLQDILKYADEGVKFEMYIWIGNELTNFNLRETFLLVTRLLPVDCHEGCEDEYRKLLEKIKTYNSSEVRSSVYQKFMNNGFKRRKYY